MITQVAFQGKLYALVLTDHVQARMAARSVSEALVVEILEHGKAIPQGTAGKYWIAKHVDGRQDNLICLVVSFEGSHAVVVTVMVGWREL